MSTVKTNNVQIGQSVTATNNFTWYQPASPDGTVRLGNGNSGSVTDLVTLTSAGNLGIGTSSPATKLHVSGTGSTPTLFERTGSNGVYLQLKDASGSSVFLGASNGVFAIQTPGSSYSDKLVVDSSGNLGLGVTPSYRLDVQAATANTTVASFSGANPHRGLRIATYQSNGGDDCGVQFLAPLTNYGAFKWTQNTTDFMTLDASGSLLVGVTTNSGYGGRHRISFQSISQGALYLSVDGGVEYSAAFQAVNSGGYSVNSAAQWVGKNSTNSRSINAGGTINASGADYAEYMVKAGDFELAKGDVCGVDANGLLTNMFSDAVSFVVKSTDPSYVGNDSWGVGFKDDPEGLEIARQKVDRIAFAGQVPVNVLGAKAGDYIIPIADKKGIKGEAVPNPTFEQYQIAVGKVIAVEADGRARIIVKVA